MAREIQWTLVIFTLLTGLGVGAFSCVAVAGIGLPLCFTILCHLVKIARIALTVTALGFAGVMIGGVMIRAAMFKLISEADHMRPIPVGEGPGLAGVRIRVGDDLRLGLGMQEGRR